MNLSECYLNMCEKLSKPNIKSFIKFLNKQVNSDVEPFIDLKHAKRDYINIDTHEMPDDVVRKLKQLENEYGGKIFKTTSNGGLGTAFHLLDKEKISEAKSTYNDLFDEKYMVGKLDMEALKNLLQMINSGAKLSAIEPFAKEIHAQLMNDKRLYPKGELPKHLKR